MLTVLRRICGVVALLYLVGWAFMVVTFIPSPELAGAWLAHLVDAWPFGVPALVFWFGLKLLDVLKTS